MTEFNEVGTVVGTKSVAILDSSGIVINTIAIDENATPEEIQHFVDLSSGHSFTDVIPGDIAIGYRYDGSAFVPQQVPIDMPEEVLNVINNAPEVNLEDLAAKQAARAEADRIDGLT